MSLHRCRTYFILCKWTWTPNYILLIYISIIIIIKFNLSKTITKSIKLSAIVLPFIIFHLQFSYFQLGISLENFSNELCVILMFAKHNYLLLIIINGDSTSVDWKFANEKRFWLIWLQFRDYSAGKADKLN